MNNVQIPISILKNISSTRPSGYVEDVISHSLKDNKDADGNLVSIELSHETYEYLKTKYRKDHHSVYIGVGTQLKKLLAKIGIKPNSTCLCNEYAKIMDTNGILWCENNKDTILSWLEHEAKKRHIPFIKYIAELILQRAINNAKYQNEMGKLNNNV